MSQNCNTSCLFWFTFISSHRCAPMCIIAVKTGPTWANITSLFTSSNNNKNRTFVPAAAVIYSCASSSLNNYSSREIFNYSIFHQVGAKTCAIKMFKNFHFFRKLHFLGGMGADQNVAEFSKIFYFSGNLAFLSEQNVAKLLKFFYFSPKCCRICCIFY